MPKFLGLLGLFGIFFAIGASLYLGYRFGKWLLSKDCPYGYKNSGLSNPYRNNFDYTKLYIKPSQHYRSISES